MHAYVYNNNKMHERIDDCGGDNANAAYVGLGEWYMKRVSDVLNGDPSKYSSSELKGSINLHIRI